VTPSYTKSINVICRLGLSRLWITEIRPILFCRRKDAALECERFEGSIEETLFAGNSGQFEQLISYTCSTMRKASQRLRTAWSNPPDTRAHELRSGDQMIATSNCGLYCIVRWPATIQA
jgi:hypothetical protein